MKSNFLKPIYLITTLVLLGIFAFNFSVSAQSKVPASLFFVGPLNYVTMGDSVTIDVRVSSPDQSINAVSGSFKIPKEFRLDNISTDSSIISLWTSPPAVANGVLSFEGVALVKPYQGNSGLLFKIIGKAIKSGKPTFSFNDGSVLANDGHGTNVIGTMKSFSFSIVVPQVILADVTSTKSTNTTSTTSHQIALSDKNVSASKVNSNSNTSTSTSTSTSISTQNQTPIQKIAPYIINGPQLADRSTSVKIVGKGMPFAKTLLEFINTASNSFSNFIVKVFFRSRKELTSVELTNDENGNFFYTTPTDLLAGVYNVIPSLVDDQTKNTTEGYGTQLIVTDSTIIILMNGAIIIILLLILIFLPWYIKKNVRDYNERHGWRRVRITEEEEK